MANEQSSPFQLPGHLAANDSKDGNAQLPSVGKSLASVSVWRNQRKKELEAKDSDIAASKASFDLLYEKLDETEKVKESLRASVEEEVPKRAEIFQRFGRLEGALRAAGNHGERLQAIADQLPKIQKRQFDKRSSLVEKLQSAIKAVDEFKAQQDSLRKDKVEKVAYAERMESFGDRNFADAQTESNDTGIQFTTKMSDMAAVREKAELPNSALEKCRQGSDAVTVWEEKIRNSSLTVESARLRGLEEQNLLDRVECDEAAVLAELQNDITASDQELASTAVAESRLLINSLIEVDLFEKKKAKLSAATRVLEERLSVLSTGSLNDQKMALLKSNADVDQQNMETASAYRQYLAEKTALEDALAKERDYQDDRSEEEVQRLGRLKAELANGTQVLEERLSVVQSSTLAGKKMKLLESTAAVERQTKENDSAYRLCKTTKANLQADHEAARAALQAADTAARADREASRAAAEAQSQSQSPEPTRTAKERTRPAKEQTVLSQERTAKRQLETENVFVPPKKPAPPKRPAPPKKPAVASSKRPIAQVSSQEESTPKRALHGMPLGSSATQNTREEMRAWSRMSDSSDDSNVSVHVAMRVAPEDRPKIPSNFGKLTRSFADEEPRREYQTLDDF